MKIIFFGSPDFAVPSLEALIGAEDMDVCLVVSQPDRKRSRNKWSSTPVKELALKHDIPVITPEKLNRQDVIDQLVEHEPDLLVVIAYGQIIGRRILEAFPRRIVNIHGSLLPEYRGAAPIQRAMLDGRPETGLTAMLIEREMDAGPMLAKRTVPIGDDDDLASLTGKLAEEGADLLLDSLRQWDSLLEKAEIQDPDRVSFADKIVKEDGYLDFEDRGKRLVDQVRTLKDWPGAKFLLEGEVYKVHQAHLDRRDDRYPNGYLFCTDGGLWINAADSAFVIDRIQAPSRKVMEVADFLRGNPLEVGLQAKKLETE